MTLPRLLVIGANGFVGAHLANAASDRFECIPAARKECPLLIDITDAATVTAAFQKAQPHVVALIAGVADIDRCQREPETARETNVLGTRNVARECARTGARLLFTSSGAVFDGTCQAYREDHRPNPISVYGASKATAENIIASLLPDAVIVRLSLVLGFPLRAATNSLVERLRLSFEAGTAVQAPVDEHRNAIDVETVARWMLDLAANPQAHGIFHLGSLDALPRYEIVRGLARAMGYPQDLVIPQDGPRPGRAPRGRYELLAPVRIGEFSSIPVPSCRQAIERCVHAAA
jgi:dTDP-4-dehydrorhamnose reductase